MILPIDEAVAPWAIGHLMRVMDHINPNWIQCGKERGAIIYSLSIKSIKID